MDRGIDGRTWQASAILRKVYKESGETFSFQCKPCAFAQLCDPKSSGVEGILMVGGAILHCQKSAVSQKLEQIKKLCPGDASWAVLGLEFDGTPEQVKFQHQTTCHSLGGFESGQMCGVREVLVVNVSLFLQGSAGPEEIFCSPLVLGDLTSGTLLKALIMSLEGAGLDLQEIAQIFQKLILIFGVDGASTNELVYSYLQPRLPDNVVSLRSPCWLHASNRIVLDHLVKSGFDLVNPMYSLILLFDQASNYEAFCEMVLLVIESYQWERGLRPDEALLRQHREFLKLYMPQGALLKDWDEVCEACDFFCLDWNGPGGHRCKTDAAGTPCCPTPEAFKANCRKHGHTLFLKHKPGRQCLSRWVKSVEGIGFFAKGFHAHSLFRIALEAVSTKRLKAENVDIDEIMNNEAGNDDEVPDEDVLIMLYQPGT